MEALEISRICDFKSSQLWEELFEGFASIAVSEPSFGSVCILQQEYLSRSFKEQVRPLGPSFHKPVDGLSLMFASPQLFQEIDDLSLPSHPKKTYTVILGQLTLLGVISPMVFNIRSDVSCKRGPTRSLDTVTYRIFMHYTDLRLQVRLCKALSESNCSARCPKAFWLLTSYPILPSASCLTFRLACLLISYLISLLTSSLAFLLMSYDIHSGIKSDICNLTFKHVVWHNFWLGHRIAQAEKWEEERGQPNNPHLPGGKTKSTLPSRKK